MRSRVELHQEWTVPRDRALLRDEVAKVLRDRNLRDAGSTETSLLFRGGSQAFRLLGGWLSRDRWLPHEVSVEIETSGEGETRLRAYASERMDTGYLDIRLRNKYSRLFAELLTDLDASLNRSRWS